jgi:hypothetical protein
MSDAFIPPEFFSPGQWFSDPRVASAPTFYILLADLFGLLLVGGLIVYVLAPRLTKGHRLRTELLRRLVTALAIVGACGLFWVGARALALPLFAKPLLLWFTLVGLFCVLGYAAYYWRRRYPAELTAWDERARRRRWMPAPRKRAAPRRR